MGAVLRKLNTLGTRNNQVVQAISWLKKNIGKAVACGGTGPARAYVDIEPAPPFKAVTGFRPPAVSQAASSVRSAAPDAGGERTGGERGHGRGLRKRDAVQPRIQEAVRRTSPSGHDPPQGTTVVEQALPAGDTRFGAVPVSGQRDLPASGAETRPPCRLALRNISCRGVRAVRPFSSSPQAKTAPLGAPGNTRVP